MISKQKNGLMKNAMKSNFLIAAANSGAGKTTITLGLLQLLASKGYKVQPFKCGPDYIDTKLHRLASGTDSINLDLFLSSKNHVKQLFNNYSATSDISIVEGVMGLFDGYEKMEGSAARIAECIDIPIVLVVNAKATAYSVAALLYGFRNFHKKINTVGVIFNMVSSESHYQFLKEACKDVGIVPLGYLPKNEQLVIPSRHLGLNTDDRKEILQVIDLIANELNKYIDIEKLLDITKTDKKNISISVPKNEKPLMKKMAVASDEAFNFLYPVNIDVLRSTYKIEYFSPIHDVNIPEDIDLMYIPGGYPELYAEELSMNHSMLKAIKSYVEQGGKVYAECGGMMYLSSNLVVNEKKYPMVGVFNQESLMEPMKLKLGYRYWESSNGKLFKGHEFHYSHIDSSLKSIVQQYGARKQMVDTKLLKYKNAIGGYTHLYWAEENCLEDLFKL